MKTVNFIKFSSFIIFFNSTTFLLGQEIIFPALKEDSLLFEIVKYYKPKMVLTYDEARSKMYSEIFIQKDSIECYYSRYKIPIPKNTNVLSWTARYGIQAEHLFPRSLGAAVYPALADLHHLVPVKSTINTLRKNYPFREIEDNKTKYWILNDKVLTKPDNKIIDQYSESATAAFEPRENIKGDIARSIFYFHSIYKSDADKKSKTFFSSMLLDLCSWHRIDKVDSTEILRSLAIARIQSNVNPFIFDPTLAERCYCANYLVIPIKLYSVNIYPNPSKGLFYIDIPDYNGPVLMKILSASGKLLETHHFMYFGSISWRLTKGLYFIDFRLINSQIEDIKILII